LISGVLDNEPGSRRDIVVLNAGAAIFVAGRARSLADGVAQAAASLESGAAGAALDAFRKANAS
jgi:anthranilate phosphoribosyltransferase